MTTASTLDVDRLRAWIGHEEAARDVVTADLVEKFLATFDLRGGKPQPRDVAPRLIHLCLAQPTAPTGMLGEDGHPRRGGFLPPVPLPRRMFASGRLSFTGDIRVGDTVRRLSRIADVAVKEGRTGGLCFVTVEHTIEVEGNAVLHETQNIVYRGMEDSVSKKMPEAAPAGQHLRKIDPSPPLLFRYSAITFNGHRIHYDRRYVTEVERYPGLVVHGPLQATQLLLYATEIRGQPPDGFAFRSQSPLFDDSSYFLHADEDGEKLRMWTAREDGPIAMSAEAAWS